MRQAFPHGIGVLIPDDAWAQAGLSGFFGGLGFRKAVEHAAGAYLASVGKSSSMDNWAPCEAEGWDDAVADLCARVGCTPLQLGDVSLRGSQFRLSQLVDKATLSNLMENASLRDRARLRTVSSEGAGAWLNVVPSQDLNLVFEPREFTSLLRFWLGMPVLDGVCACPWCGQAQDRFGYHALTCRKTGLKVLRHNALREVCLFQFVVMNLKIG